jgi:hypothetical protein
MKYPDDAMGQRSRCADPDRVAGSRAVAGWLAVRIDDAATGCCLQTGEEMTARGAPAAEFTKCPSEDRENHPSVLAHGLALRTMPFAVN